MYHYLYLVSDIINFKSMTVSLIAPPSIIQGFNMTVYNTSDNLILVCAFVSVPVSNITWYRQTVVSSITRLILEDHRITIQDSKEIEMLLESSGSGSGVLDYLSELLEEFRQSSNLPVAISALEITSLEYADEGNYSCIANNTISNLINSTDSRTEVIIVQSKSMSLN